MKRLFTLLFVPALFTVAFANNNEDYEKKRNAVYSERFKKDKDGRWRKNHNWKKERDMEIENINKEYDNKIRDVQNRWITGRNKKQRLIRELEEQRWDEIQLVYEKYQGPGEWYTDGGKE